MKGRRSTFSVLVVLILTGCGQPEQEYRVVVVPGSFLANTGFEQRANVYLVRQLGPGEASIHIDQDSTSTELLKDGSYEARWVANKVGRASLSGSLILENEGKDYEFQQAYFAFPPVPVVSSRYLLRGRRNKIECGVPGLPGDAITVQASNGVVEKRDDGMYLTPGEGDTSKIYLVYERAMGKRYTSEPVVFEVVDVR